MKILHLISSGGYYGAENMLLNLVTADHQALSENLLAVFHNQHKPNIELYDRALAKGVSAKIVPCRGKADWRSVRQIRELVRAHEIDIIHTHGYKADLYGYWVGRREGKPVVATCHNWLPGGAALAVYNFLDRIALKHFDGISAVSPAIAEKLISLGVRRDRITIIPNGINVDAFNPGTSTHILPGEARKEQILGIVGRLDLQKGFEYLLRAMAALRQTFPAIRLLIAGEGPDREKIETLISQLGLSSVVTLAGQQTDMASVYHSIDIFVLPSLNEGLPLSLLEAMAASRPVIATRVGAVPTVITDGATGLLVEPADQAGLAKAISRLLSDPDLCRRLAQQARACVEQRYTAAAMAQRYREWYGNLLILASLG